MILQCSSASLPSTPPSTIWQLTLQTAARPLCQAPYPTLHCPRPRAHLRPLLFELLVLGAAPLHPLPEVVRLGGGQVGVQAVLAGGRQAGVHHTARGGSHQGPVDCQANC